MGGFKLLSAISLIPVLLTYWTAWVEDGVVYFREDPYERDARTLAALDR